MPILSADDSLLTAADLVDLPGAPFSDVVVSMVCEAVRVECGWHIAPERTETVTLDSPGGRVLMLPTLHLTSVAAVRNMLPDTPTDLIGWRKSRAGMLSAGCRWPCGFESVEVTMTHGYANCPAGLAAAIGALCAVAALNPAVASESAGSVSISYRDLAAGLSYDQQLATNAIIAHYKLPSRP